MLPAFKTPIALLPELVFVRELEGFEGSILSEFKAVHGDGIFLEKYCTEHEGVQRWLIVRTERRALAAYLEKRLSMRHLLTVTSGGLGFIVDRKEREEVARYLVTISELPEKYIPGPDVMHDETLRPDMEWKPKLLDAVARKNFSEAFEIIFDLVGAFEQFGQVLREVHTGQPAEPRGNLQGCEDLLFWFASEGVIETLPLDVIVAVLRLPSPMSEHLRNWNPALKAAWEELTERGEDAKALLHGLKDRTVTRGA